MLDDKQSKYIKKYIFVFVCVYVSLVMFYTTLYDSKISNCYKQSLGIYNDTCIL